MTTAVLGLSSVALAQPIHDGCPAYDNATGLSHPTTTKAAYISPADWHTFSTQDHNSFPGVNSMQPTMPSHGHLDLAGPFCAEVGAVTLLQPFSITAFMADGKYDLTDAITSAWLDGDANGQVVSYSISNDPVAFRQSWLGAITATTEHPAWPQPTCLALPCSGSDTGVVIAEGTMLVNYAQPFYGVRHGWSEIRVAANFHYDNGDAATNALGMSFYSMIEATGPESGFHPNLESIVSASHRADPGPDAGGYSFGAFCLFSMSPPPLDPVSSANPFTVGTFGYCYVDSGGMSQFSTWRNDADLHHGVPGEILGQTAAFVGSGGAGTAQSITLPADLTTGVHGELAQWTISGPGPDDNSLGLDFSDRTLTQNLKFFVVVGDNSNPLPPPHVPVITWITRELYNQYATQQEQIDGVDQDLWRLLNTLSNLFTSQIQ